MATVNADASGKLSICTRGSVVRAREPFTWTVRGIRLVFVLCIHYVCRGETVSIFFRDLNDASNFELVRRMQFFNSNHRDSH